MSLEPPTSFAGSWLAIWGAVLSSILFALKLWETFLKDRPRIATTYSFVGHDQMEDEIVIANLSQLPIQVSSWKLEWQPKLFNRDRGAIEVAPEDVELRTFTIPGFNTKILKFSELNKIPWGHKISKGRKLVLTLSLFGHRRPIRCKIT